MIIDFDSKNKGGGGKEPVVEALNVTANGSYNAPSGVDGYNPVEVNVPQREPVLESLSVTDNGTYTPESGVDGYNSVSVNVQQSGGFDFNQLYGVRFNTDGTSIDLTGLGTSTFTSMNSMFSSCGNLTSIDLSHFDTSNVTDMSNMFSYCYKLKSLDLSHFDTSKVRSMYGIFSMCRSIKSINLSGLDTSNVTDMSSIFSNCYSLETINCDGLQLPNIDMPYIHLSYCSKLTVDSIVGMLNALPTTTNGYSFDIGTDNIAKLSEDQKAIATTKGWQLV